MYWEGPTRKIWSDIQCSNLRNLPSDYDKKRCKEVCRQKRGCTAFNYNEMGGCELRACSSRIPAPAWDRVGHEGYYLTTGNVALEGLSQYNFIPTLYNISNTAYNIFDIMMKRTVTINCMDLENMSY